jgi:large subunit ribosomal protein L10
MKMSKREEKVRTVDNLQSIFSECSIGVLTDYLGLSASEMTDLRRKLGESGIEYRVVKNTLARFAAEGAGRDDLLNFFQGPVAIAFGYSDITEPARVLADYTKAVKTTTLSIKGGFLSYRLLTAEEVRTLATLPSKEILLSKVVGGMQGPIYGLLNCLTNPMREIIGVLQARINQMEGE